MSRRIHVLGPTLLLGLLSDSALHAGEYKQNVRELCRVEVSSLALGLWNEAKLYREQAGTAETRLKGLRVQLERVAKDGRGPQGKSSPSDANIVAEQALVGLQFERTQLEMQVRELENLRDLSREKMADREKRLQEFETLARQVFVRKDRPPAQKEAPQPFRWEYQMGCSEYELLCPLPAAQRTMLGRIAEALPEYASILGRDADPEPCHRYAQIQRGTR